MADKSIDELIPATSVTPTDLFVLEQNNTAKKLTGQVLENWLVSFADGHGGIQSIKKQETSGLNDTYRITLADTTTFDFVVTNGKGITGISKTSTGGLVDTYTIQYNDSTASTFTVTNGAKGDKGDNVYTWFKYASEKPTSSSSSMGDEPDNWLGLYSGNKSEPPTDPMEYTWSLIKGEKGQTGDPATIITNKTEYQVSDSGTIIPSGIWSTSIPVVTPGKYLWARTTTQFNTGSANYSYSISRFGIDGTGAVSTVNGVAPDEFGNVELTAEQLNVLGLNGGTMEGPIHMNGQPITGLNDPTDGTDAVRKSYVDTNDLNTLKYASPANLLDNSYFRYPVAQAGIGGNHGNQAYAVDRWILTTGSVSHQEGVGLTLNGTITQKLEHNPIFNAQAFVGMASGQASISYSDGAVTITSSGGVIAWAALYDTYENVYSEQVLPEYHPKGYAAEFVECQRYYRNYNLTYAASLILPGFVTSSAKIIELFPPDTTPMRTSSPTILFSGTVIIRGVNGYATDHGASGYSGADVAVYQSASTHLSAISITKSDGSAWGLTNNTPVVVQFSSNPVFEYHADL